MDSRPIRTRLKPSPVALCAWAGWGLILAAIIEVHDGAPMVAVAWALLGIGIGSFSGVLAQGLGDFVGALRFRIGRLEIGLGFPLAGGLVIGSTVGPLIGVLSAGTGLVYLSAPRAAIDGAIGTVAAATLLLLPLTVRWRPQYKSPPRPIATDQYVAVREQVEAAGFYTGDLPAGGLICASARTRDRRCLIGKTFWLVERDGRWFAGKWGEGSYEIADAAFVADLCITCLLSHSPQFVDASLIQTCRLMPMGDDQITSGPARPSRPARAAPAGLL